MVSRRFGVSVFAVLQLFEEQSRFPADAFGVGFQLLESAVLDLANAFFGDAEQVTDLAQAVCAVAGEPEAEVENFPFAWAEVFHEETKRFLSFVILLHHQSAGVRHGFCQFEIAIVVEDGVQADRSAGCGLEVREVFERATSAVRQFLRTRKMLAAVCERFAFLLEQTELLQVVRAEADQVTLTRHRDLQRLANPPRGVSRKTGAVAHIESVNGLHETANRFLQQIAIRKAVVPEPLGDVSREADVGAGEAVLEVDVAVVKSLHRKHIATRFGAVFADKLCHRPRFAGRTERTEIVGEISQQSANQFVFAVPETR